MKIIFLCFIFLSGLVTTSRGQTISADLRSLSKSAEVILTGKVIERHSAWNEDQTKIYRHVKIYVEEYLKGGTGSNSVTISHPGGEVGEIGELYSHVPTFTDNEEVLLFLKKSNINDEYIVFEGENGKIQLTTDQKTGEKITADKKNISTVKNQIRKYISGN